MARIPSKTSSTGLRKMAKETVEKTVKARCAMRTQLTILSTRTGPTACHIQSSHPGR